MRASIRLDIAIAHFRLGILALSLGACSATYSVAHVSPADAQTSRPGIYYALPRTELLAVLTVAQTAEKTGKYSGEAWAACTLACLRNGKNDCPSAETGEVISYEITGAKVYSRAVADVARLYRLNVDFDTFAAFNHTFKLTNEGVLSSSSSELENKSVEVAINTTKALAKLAVSVRGAPPPQSRNSCSAFRTDYALKGELDRASERLRAKLDAVLFERLTPTGPAIEQLVKRTEVRLKELRAMERYRTLVADLSARKDSKSIGNFAIKIEPKDYESVEATADWKPIQAYDTEGFAGLESTPADLTASDDVLLKLNATDVRVKVAPVVQSVHFDCDIAPTEPPANYSQACTGKSKGGFRYRIPSAATVVISELNPRTRSRETLAASRALVAQYGALVTLPATVSGLKSKIALDLYESTGSPRQMEVGATPQASTLAGDVSAPVEDELDRRRKAKEETEKTAEQAEVNELTKQRDVLKLKKEISEFEDALKKDQTDVP